MSILATEKLISSVKYKAVARLAVRLRKANNNKEPNKKPSGLQRSNQAAGRVVQVETLTIRRLRQQDCKIKLVRPCLKIQARAW